MSERLRLVDPRSFMIREACPALVIEPYGLWFRVHGGPEVHLDRWPTLQKILRRLAIEHAHRPGEPVSLRALIEAGWPDQRMGARAGATRIHTAIYTLRRMGLRELLVRAPGGGYLLVTEAS